MSILYFHYIIGKYYLRSTCNSKKIYLRPNKLDKFPIEEIVFKGLDNFNLFLLI